MDICVVGGGISGLTLAYELSQDGWQVTLIEKDNQLGGSLGYTMLDDIYVDKFYHIFSNSDNNILRLLSKLGLSQAVKPINVKNGFFYQGCQFPLSGLWDLITFPPLNYINRVRLGLTSVFTKMRGWKRLENISAKDWLSSVGGDYNYELFWEPMFKSKFGEFRDAISAVDLWSRNDRVNRVRNREARYIRGGFKTLIDRMEKLLVEQNVTVCKATTANKIREGPNGRLIIDSSLGSLSFAKIILAMPSPLAERLLDDFSGYGSFLSRAKYVGNISLLLKLKHTITPYYMLAVADERSGITSIINYSGIYPENTSDTYAINYISRYFSSDTRAAEKSDEDIMREILPQLSTMNPEFSENWIQAFTINRAAFVEPMVTMGFSKHIPNFQTPIKNLYLIIGSQAYPYTPVVETSLNVCYQFLNKFKKGCLL